LQPLFNAGQGDVTVFRLDGVPFSYSDVLVDGYSYVSSSNMSIPAFAVATSAYVSMAFILLLFFSAMGEMPLLTCRRWSTLANVSLRKFRRCPRPLTPLFDLRLLAPLDCNEKVRVILDGSLESVSIVLEKVKVDARATSLVFAILNASAPRSVQSPWTRRSCGPAVWPRASHSVTFVLNLGVWSGRSVSPWWVDVVVVVLELVLMCL
ncbi:DUF1744-domain-containing protein, partial [Aureobasidium melanogenum]